MSYIPLRSIPSLPDWSCNRFRVSHLITSVKRTASLCQDQLHWSLSLLLFLIPFLLVAQQPELVVPMGHTTGLTYAQFLPDGKHILTRSPGENRSFFRSEAEVILWNKQGQILQRLTKDAPNPIGFSPDGTRLLDRRNSRVRLRTLSGNVLLNIKTNSSPNPALFTPDGQAILVAAPDSTAKLWSLSGELIQEFKGKVSVLAVAVSPNGEEILTGGADGIVRRWNLAGQLLKQSPIANQSQSITGLAYSPDGRYYLTMESKILITTWESQYAEKTATLWTAQGIQLKTFPDLESISFSPDSKQLLLQTKDRKTFDRKITLYSIEEKRGKNLPGRLAAFSPKKDHIVTVSSPRTLNLLDKKGRLIRSFQGHAASILNVSFSPDGQSILTASYDKSAKIWNLEGELISDLSGHTSWVTTVAFSPDSNRILTGTGSWAGFNRDSTAKLWDVKQRKIQNFTGHRRHIGAAAFAPDGKSFVTGSADGTVKWWDINGALKKSFPYNRWAKSVAFSPDGASIVAGGTAGVMIWDTIASGPKPTQRLPGGGQCVRFLADGKHIVAGSASGASLLNLDSLSSTSIAAQGWWLDTSKDGKYVVFVHQRGGISLHTFDGKNLQLVARFADRHSRADYVVFSPDSQSILSGHADHKARLWDLEGNLLQTYSGHRDAVSSVAFSPNGKYVLTGSKDSQMKLWPTAHNEELATLLQVGAEDWVVTTPSGLFDASEGAKNNMHYVIHKGEVPEVIALESLEYRYWVPGLLKRLLAGESAKNIRDVGQLKLEALYPRIRARLDTDQLIIDIKERSGGLGELNLYINGSIVNKDLNRSDKSHLEIPLKKYAKHFYTKRTNVIGLQAFNKAGWMKSPRIKLPPYTPSFPIQRDHKLAHLYAIVVGTSDYTGSNLDLSYAAKDAVSMHQALTLAGEQLFQDRIDVRLFATEDVPKAGQPTKNNIQRAIDEIAAKAEPIDLVLVYLAGHGKAIDEGNNKSRFYYLTKSIGNFRQLEDTTIRSLDAISQEELTDWLSVKIGAKKKVMVLDACNSGQVIKTLIQERSFSESQLVALDRMKDRTGMYILAGSAADRESFEATPFGQGLLTYSLLQGMQELATRDPNDEVDVLQLLMHAENQVPKLAKSLGVAQEPKMYNQDGLSSFPIGIVRDPSVIPVAAVKPILIQPLLVKEGEPEDPLDLISTLESYIQKQVRRGRTFTFRNVRKNKEGYSIRGTYSLSKERLIARVYLRKGAKKITTEDLVVEGRKDKIEELIELIFERIEPYIK